MREALNQMDWAWLETCYAVGQIRRGLMAAGVAECTVRCLSKWSPYKTDGPAWGRVERGSPTRHSAKAEFESCLSGRSFVTCANTPRAKAHPEPAKYSDFNWGGYGLVETAFYL